MTTIFHHTSQTHKSTLLLHTDTPRKLRLAYKEAMRNDHIYTTLHYNWKNTGPAWQDTIFKSKFDLDFFLLRSCEVSRLGPV